MTRDDAEADAGPPPDGREWSGSDSSEDASDDADGTEPTAGRRVGDGADPEPRVLPPDSDAADRALDALGSESTRTVLWSLYERPRTARDVAAAMDCSVQNAHYHLRKLVSADLAEVVGTRFPENGNHRDVYGPTSDPLLLPGSEETTEEVSALVDRLLAVGLAAVALLSAAVAADRLLVTDRAPPSGPASVGGDGGALATADPLAVVAVAAVVAALSVVAAVRLSLR